MSWLDAFKKSSGSAVWYLALVVVLPILTLSLAGMVFLWQNDLLLLVLAGWLAVTLAGYAFFTITERGNDTSASATETLPESLAEKSYWTDRDLQVWHDTVAHIESRLTDSPAWEALPDECLQLLSQVSAQYNPGVFDNAKADDRSSKQLPYRFTLPEALIVLSVASERYRTIILEHVPFAEKISVASLLNLYASQQTIKSGYSWFNTIRRTVRLSNPVAAAIGELRDQFTNRVFDHFSENVQTELKRLLLQEVAQVGIDLYSGNLKSSNGELERYRSTAYLHDATRQSEPVEPLRVVLIGQVSSGKSSLVNALIESLQAETDILPSTDTCTAHQLALDGIPAMHLIDTVGLTSSAESRQAALKLAMDADMIVLVAQANRPARDPDQLLIEAIQDAFSASAARRMPAMMLVMTHVDQLKPMNLWSPPYELDSDDRKAQNMMQALRSAITQIGLPADIASIPVCVNSEKGYYNIDAVAAQIMLLQSDATLTQLNRRRAELNKKPVSWNDRWQQVKRTGLVLGRAAIGKQSSSIDK